jgi:hypothetical protein
VVHQVAEVIMAKHTLAGFNVLNKSLYQAFLNNKDSEDKGRNKYREIVSESLCDRELKDFLLARLSKEDKNP